MAPTGSLDKSIAALALVNWNNRQSLEASEPFKAYSKGMEGTLTALKAAGKSGDLDRIIGVESTLVALEHQFNKNLDPSAMPSLNAATVDFSVVGKGLGVVRSAEAYQKVDDAHHTKRKVHGVPIDGFHEAINSHITRLGNRMSTLGISIPEKNVLRQRQANMRIAKELYIGLQCKALGVEPPKRGKGQELGR